MHHIHRTIDRRAWLALLAALCVIGGGLLVSSRPAQASGIPGFEVFCFYSHTLQDDPIVTPALPGMASHLHDFAGNNSTTARSTYASMIKSSSRCEHPGDTAAYWTPVLYSHGRAVRPDRLHSYYRWGTFKDVKRIVPVPADLRMVAGNAKAVSPQDTNVIGWNCGVRGSKLFDHPVSCSHGRRIVLHIFFPSCWDGKHLDTPDHKSHMAYVHNGVCPSSHPVAIPKLSEDYGYPVTDGSGISLSSGPYYSAHADYWNTWHQSQMDELTRDCINKGRQCGPVTGPVGR